MRNVDINQKNVCKLLVSADYLSVKPSRTLLRLPQGMLAPENCIAIMRFARDFCCPGLEEDARCCVMRNFVPVSQQSDEPLELPPEKLQATIGAVELNVQMMRGLYGRAF
jgi:hypothetical protein